MIFECEYWSLPLPSVVVQTLLVVVPTMPVVSSVLTAELFAALTMNSSNIVFVELPAVSSSCALLPSRLLEQFWLKRKK